MCLSCVSEINNCYTFILKCESSLDTLRQLIPNALQSEQLHADSSTQTEAVECKQVHTETENESMETNCNCGGNSQSNGIKKRRKSSLDATIDVDQSFLSDLHIPIQLIKKEEPLDLDYQLEQCLQNEMVNEEFMEKTTEDEGEATENSNVSLCHI
mgnify:CR=1 FL=1